MHSNLLIELDRQHLVHPVNSWRGHEGRGATVLDHGQGCFVADASGHELLDGFAGLWCVNVGYGQETIVEAAAEQMRRLPYATGYFHFASDPAIRLAAELADLAPGDLNRVYFTLGGSDAVDSAIKMVRFYFNATGRPNKKQFIALERGYHGSSSLGSGLNGAIGVSRRLRFAPALAASHRLAFSLSPSPGRCAGAAHCRVGRRAEGCPSSGNLGQMLS